MKARFYDLKRRAQRRNPEIVLTPLIDTALTLLIIFMVATPMLKKENALEIELPKGNVKEISDTTQQEIIISFDKAGKISFNNTIMSHEKLFEELKKIPAGQKKTVFVKADSTAAYGQVIELVDSLKKVEGIAYVALATQEPKHVRAA